MSRVNPDENPEYPDSPRYDEYGEVKSSIGENSGYGGEIIAERCKI